MMGVGEGCQMFPGMTLVELCRLSLPLQISWWVTTIPRGGLPSTGDYCLRFVQKEEGFGPCSEWVQSSSWTDCIQERTGPSCGQPWKDSWLSPGGNKKMYNQNAHKTDWQQRARWRLQEGSEAFLPNKACSEEPESLCITDWFRDACQTSQSVTRNSTQGQERTQKDSKVRLMWSLAVTKIPGKSSQNHCTAHLSSDSVKLMDTFFSKKIHSYYSVFNSFHQLLGYLWRKNLVLQVTSLGQRQWTYWKDRKLIHTLG